LPSVTSWWINSVLSTYIYPPFRISENDCIPIGYFILLMISQSHLQRVLCHNFFSLIWRNFSKFKTNWQNPNSCRSWCVQRYNLSLYCARRRNNYFWKNCGKLLHVRITLHCDCAKLCNQLRFTQEVNAWTIIPIYEMCLLSLLCEIKITNRLIREKRGCSSNINW